MNPSVHSGQGHSLAVCRALEQWFANGGRSVTFVMVHSRFEWGPHHEAHEFVRGLPPVGGRRMATSLDSLRKEGYSYLPGLMVYHVPEREIQGPQFLVAPEPRRRYRTADLRQGRSLAR